MYSRNYSGRGNGRWNGGNQRSGSDRDSLRPSHTGDMQAKPVPPPAYSGTLYISARNAEAEKDKRSRGERTVKARSREINSSSDPSGAVRTVRYNGEPYIPDQTGFNNYERDRFGNGGPSREDDAGKGGHPDLGDSLRFRRGPRGPIVGDRSDIDYYGPSETASSNPLSSLLPFDIPSPEDIILIALIITLISARSTGEFNDDILIIILGVLLLSGRQGS